MAAFDSSSRNRGQLENAPIELIKGNKPTKKLTLSSGDESSYEISVPVEHVRGSESRGFKSNSVLIPPWALRDTPWVRAVQRAEEPQRFWLLYCYTENQDWHCVESLCFYLYETALKHEVDSIAKDTKKLLKALSFMALQDFRSEARTGKPLKSQKDIRLLAGKAEANWKKHWSPRWRRMREALAELDKIAINEVYRHASAA